MYAEKKPIENTHIVRERDRERFRELLAVFALGVPLALFLLLFTWENVEVIRLGREATQLQATRKALEDSNKNLRLETERLTSLSAVESKANALGLARTDAARVVLVERAPSSLAEPIPAARSQSSSPSPNLPERSR
jgi:cell division protein FtsL